MSHAPRRRIRLSAAVAAVAASAVLLLAGCSSSPNAVPASDSAGGTISVDTLYGKVEVPAGAKRIVAFDFPEATALADLGVKPVGIGSYTPSLPAYDAFFKGVPIITDDAGLPDLEKIAAAKPDLIIGDMFATDIEKNRSLYDQLTSIAPTVILEWTQAAGNWPVDAAGTARAVGKSAELDKLKSAYEKHAADIKSTYGDVLKAHTVDLMDGTASDWYLYGPNSSHGQVLAAAGAQFGAAADQTDGYVEYSPEKFDILAKTDLILSDSAEDTGDSALTTNPVFAGLPAVQAGNLVATTHFFPSSYQIADALLTDFESALKNAKWAK